MAILSIQSQVLNGSVGNSGAGFILARLGHEVWPLPTVLLSHHPGHGAAAGGPVKPARLGALIAGLAARHAFERCQAVMSGYLGAEAAVPVVIDAVKRARAANPDALFACDPVIGDNGRAYVPEPLISEFRHRLLPLADLAFPNPFELATLTDMSSRTKDEAFEAMAALGPRMVILTGFSGTDTAEATLDVLMLDNGDRCVVSVPRVGDSSFAGAGDAFAAFFMGAFLRNRCAWAALTAAARAMSALLDATIRSDSEDLAIVFAQSRWVSAMTDEKAAI